MLATRIQTIPSYPGLARHWLRWGEGGSCADCGQDLHSGDRVVIAIDTDEIYCCLPCAADGQHVERE